MQASKQKQEREREKGLIETKETPPIFFAFFVNRDWGYLYFFS